jgi:ferritin-like metal-binding protein YciE
MKMKTLNDLLVHELKDIHSAEKQLLKALPKMAHAVTSPSLQQALEDHLQETQAQLERLEQIMNDLQIPLRGRKCEAMEGLIEEGKSLLEEKMDPQVLDAAIIAACQRVEHYEIAAYGCARTFAELLGMPEVAATLQLSLDEEGATDKKLTEIAMSHINQQAMEPEPEAAGMESER